LELWFSVHPSVPYEHLGTSQSYDAGAEAQGLFQAQSTGRKPP
jgi:hypothetical protein